MLLLLLVNCYCYLMSAAVIIVTFIGRVYVCAGSKWQRCAFQPEVNCSICPLPDEIDSAVRRPFFWFYPAGPCSIMGVPTQLDIFYISGAKSCLDHRFRAHPQSTLPIANYESTQIQQPVNRTRLIKSSRLYGLAAELRSHLNIEVITEFSVA